MIVIEMEIVEIRPRSKEEEEEEEEEIRPVRANERTSDLIVKLSTTVDVSLPITR